MNTSTEQLPPLVLYHANCADGFGAAFAAWKVFGDKAEYVPVQYDKTLYYAESGLLAVAGDKVYEIADRTVYILDFSFSKDVMDSLFAIAGTRIVWLDHHKTAFDMYGLTVNTGDSTFSTELDVFQFERPSNSYVCLDNTRSGALIAWEYFHPMTPAPLLIKHLDDYDRWVFKIPGTKEFNKALWSLAPWNFQQWDELVDTLREYANEYYDIGAAILRAHDQNVQSVLTSTRRECTLTWYESCKIDNPHEDNKTLSSARQVSAVGLSSNCPAHLASDVGHALAVESRTYGLCWYMESAGLIKCSLRSTGSYDVSIIASKFGGGGHKTAAGFTCSMDTLSKFLNPITRSM